MFAEALSSLFASPAPFRGNASLENPRFSLNDPAAYDFLGGGGKSAAGVVVTHENALTLAAVYQAVSLISGDVSKLPVYPYQRLVDDDREIADKHPSYFAVSIRANPSPKSAKRFWRDLMVHALLWTNGYGYIRRIGREIELYNMLPDRTAPEWVTVDDPRAPGGKRAVYVYVTEVDGNLVTLMPSQVLHIRGISLDGSAGADLTRYARDAWGLAIAAQNFKSKFFKNGARMGGTLELPAGMTKPARDNVEEGFRKTYEEGDNPFRTVILREGAKFHAGQVTPQEGQVSELSDDQKREVASFFNVPPSMLGIRDSVSYNSFEQERLAYKEGCLSHWTGDIADECNMKLLTEEELRTDSHYFEHNYSKFGQADTKTLNESLEIQRRNEIINANEWRRKINMNKRPDKGGDEYINPNTRSADSQSPEEQPGKPSAKPDEGTTNAARRLIVDAINRMSRRVGHDVRQASKNSGKFLAWLDGKASDHKNVFDETVKATAGLCAMLLGKSESDVLNQMASEFFDSLLASLSPLVEPGNSATDLQANVEREMVSFERTAGERIAALVMESDNV